jgi:hypothetical protein
LDREAFVAGVWLETLMAARESPPPVLPAPAPTGGADAASLLRRYLK